MVVESSRNVHVFAFNEVFDCSRLRLGKRLRTPIVFGASVGAAADGGFGEAHVVVAIEIDASVDLLAQGSFSNFKPSLQESTSRELHFQGTFPSPSGHFHFSSLLLVRSSTSFVSPFSTLIIHRRVARWRTQPRRHEVATAFRFGENARTNRGREETSQAADETLKKAFWERSWN